MSVVRDEMTGPIKVEDVTDWKKRTWITCAYTMVDNDTIRLMVGWGIAGRPEYKVCNVNSILYNGYSLLEAVEKYNRAVS